VPRILPNGLETQIGQQWDGGDELSDGQWQKLALDGAMMHEQPLLVVFDAPTSALDPQAEHALFERIAATARSGANTAGTVTLLISHCFSTVRMADHIVALADGRILERGGHAELLRRGGLYAELYRLQSRAYRGADARCWASPRRHPGQHAGRQLLLPAPMATNGYKWLQIVEFIAHAAQRPHEPAPGPHPTRFRCQVT